MTGSIFTLRVGFRSGFTFRSGFGSGFGRVLVAQAQGESRQHLPVCIPGNLSGPAASTGPK
jgi:hypothetical protein